MDYEVLVVGAGIAGMESSLSLADMGHKVLLVEKEPSVGGKMILLSKVFPTLDCASCISTPKMAATANHPMVDVSVNSEVVWIEKQADGTFKAEIKKNPTYINPSACTGCGQCELACTVAMPDHFNADLVASRAAHIAFPQAVPKKAVITRYGMSPCSHTCPAGVKAHGYVSLVRSGKYEEAFQVHLEDAPLPGSLSRACYAPCEGECTRGDLEGPVPIRGIKRFMVDWYYERHTEPDYGPPGTETGKKVAVVGSGPTGLSAAYFLALKGHEVKIFEAQEEPGGMLRYGIPSYRLPKDIVDRDVKNITALGVEIETGRLIESISALKQEGFDAVIVAVGTMEPISMKVEGENLDGVVDCMTFLKNANTGKAESLSGKTVVVVGGGNAAIDSARTALRLGAAKVVIQYRRSRAEMPAHTWEIEAALEEGVQLQELVVPISFQGSGGRLKSINVQKMRLGEPDESGRRRPEPIRGSEQSFDADLVVLAVGIRPGTDPFASELKLGRGGRIEVDEETLATSEPGVFAGGDAVTGPSMIVKAIGQGKRLAFYVDRFLTGEQEDVVFDERLPAVGHKDVILRSGEVTRRDALKIREIPVKERFGDGFPPVEQAFTEEEARAQANRCLDCGGCSECHQCVTACPADAIDFSQREETKEVTVGTVLLSTGFKLFNPAGLDRYGFGKYPNVITAMQMDRLLAPTRPYSSVLRPGDGKAPENIAFVLCTGSRDHTVGHALCSRVCCMYSIKQSQLIMGALPLADITIYYIDIRAFGKGYEEFFQQAKGMGVNFVEGKVGLIEELENGDLEVTYEDIAGGGKKTARHDLVVLSIGLLPNPDALSMFKNAKLDSDLFSYILETDEDLDPGKTSIEGVYVAGSATAVRDIPDTILHSGAAAAQAAAYLNKLGVEK